MRRGTLQTIGALLLGAAVAAGVWLVFHRADEFASPPTTSFVPTPTADVEPFLDAFARSRTGTYRVIGHLDTEGVGDGATERVPVSITRRGTDVIEIWGPTISATLGARQQICDRVPDAGLVCGAVTDPVSVGDEVDELRRQLTGDPPDYQLYAAGDGCWRLVATVNPAIAVWGQLTTICFDPATGAIVEQTTSGSAGRRSFTVDDVTAQVTDADLVPPLE
jgi:hypothetical protein